MFSRERCIFLFDENSLNSTSTSRRTSSLSTTILSDGQVSDGGRVALEALPAAASSSQLPRSVPPSSDEEEVILVLEITKRSALVANTNSTVEHIKALFRDKEQIDDEHSQQLFLEGGLSKMETD
ncbi:hypothetical protein NL676_021402 [Syzygium grande]|nr:hypothetical protein NL676_021402 [Syzygium grande]